jgi:hypothetical protein
LSHSASPVVILKVQMEQLIAAIGLSIWNSYQKHQKIICRYDHFMRKQDSPSILPAKSLRIMTACIMLILLSSK